MRNSLRALFADPAPLPRDCGYLNPNGPALADLSCHRMQGFDRLPQHLRMVETIAGDPNLARYIVRTTTTEDRAELEAIAQRMWEQSRR